MATLPLPQKGSHLTSVVLTGQLVSTAGVLSDSTVSATLSAVIDGLNEEYNVNTEEISALNSTRQNNVILDEGANLTFQVFKVNNGSTPTALRNLYNSFDYFKAAWVEGTGGSQETKTGYGLRGGLTTGFQGKGKQIASLTLLPVDVGSAQVVTS